MAKDNVLQQGRTSQKIGNLTNEEILHDFKICCQSREMSLMGRREVLSGKAKFGIFGAGKELPQTVMARFFQKGDFRSGYYRDQTFMLAIGACTLEDLFAQLYADADNDPFSGGLQMNNHFATPLIDENDNWLNHKEMYNVSSDISSTAGQMPRALGLALSSKLYRESKVIPTDNNFSNKGNEVTFATIGDASTSEGIFWEALNAAGVMQVPMAVSVWDDGYGISVPIDYQTTKGSISEALKGLKYDSKKKQGIDIHTARAWNYTELFEMYEKGIKKVRKDHRPALFHVTEVTQPQGHSTSGSHERYKSKDRLAFETEYDCINQMGDWIVKEGIATAEEVEAIRKEALAEVKAAKKNAWNAFLNPIKEEFQNLEAIYAALPVQNEEIARITAELKHIQVPTLRELLQNARRIQFSLITTDAINHAPLDEWINNIETIGAQRYHSYLYSESDKSPMKAAVIPAQFSDDSPMKAGYEILNAFFDKAFDKHPELFTFGEDVGQIGGVNQAMAGMQEKYGKERIFDAGIREWSIVGQAVGMAIRGLRPIAEIQYLDYLIYGLQPLTDDLATIRYRSKNTQQAPAIIRTRGHRLEGIWHSGSPLGMMINALRGMHVLVPRNMTQAAGMYNTLLQSNDPAIVIESLNGYRLKERMPDNIGEFTVPLGVPEIMNQGTDITLVTYGSCVRIAERGVEMLATRGISVELIDAQSLLPFDTEGVILESLKKTNRIVFMDEDVPGGATAYMMREVLETQGGYKFLDSTPTTLTAAAHRPPFGDDGDYFSKPNAENVFTVIYRLMHESDPSKYPAQL